MNHPCVSQPRTGEGRQAVLPRHVCKKCPKMPHMHACRTTRTMPNPSQVEEGVCVGEKGRWGLQVCGNSHGVVQFGKVVGA